jgi:nucleotide-binding universal stress UspA family protein
MSVVTGYVPTPEGEAALEQAIVQARARDARLVVVNSSRGDALVDERYVQPDEATTLEARLGSAGVDHLLVQSIRGRDAADEVLDAAEQHRADLIVIGLRRRSPVGKLIMGSTAQRILLEALCPVLAVKASRA